MAQGDLFQHPRARGPRGKSGDSAAEETIEGVVGRIVYAGGDGEFTVARLEIAGRAEPVTVVGALMGVPSGARLRVTGAFEQSSRFGEQFRVGGFTEVAPATIEGIRKYLGSGLIKGIGPEFASRIVAHFAIETLEILDKDPDRIREVPGIGRKRAQAVADVWRRQRTIRKVMVFLQGYGVSPAFAARIYKRYGESALARVRENPFRLAFDVWGIGFRSADRLAGALGIAKESASRIEAGVRHVLAEAAGNGHVFLPRERLHREAAALLEVDEALVPAAVDSLGRAGDVAIDGDAVYDADLYRAELSASQGLRRLLDTSAAAIAVDVERAIAWYEQQAGIQLARQQAEAVRMALASKVAVITGGPGVGKTTIVRGVVDILGRKGVRVALAAPTGRAARRLSEATGAPASTLHRLLEWRPKGGSFGRSAERPIEADLLVVDEASMLDVRLAADLFAALAPSTRLLLVGDVDQLPSVGPGTVLRDIIASGAVPTARLTEIFRQAAASLIVTNAHRINAGDLPEMGSAPTAGPGGGGGDTRDFFFMAEEDPAAAAALVRDLVVTRLPRRYGFAPHDIQVLTPMHRGELGAQALNAALQAALAPGGPELRRGGRPIRLNDRVMQVRNDYDKDVFNGDIGRVLSVDEAGATLRVLFDEREVEYGVDELDQLQLAYAATVHKSQGSEYPAVVVPVHTQHYVMLQRNLLYTAVTRGKRLCVLVGTRKALSLAVRNAEIADRCSHLADRLAAGPAGRPR